MADKFNAYNPPKKIDFLRMSVIELADGSGAYHMEAFIDGEYIKHNSNAGYVADESQAGVSRRTPQCFSHFTYVYRGRKVAENFPVDFSLSAIEPKFSIITFRFIESNFKFMIVDIQGVQDIYTDPQIHTIDGKGYGEGNLGIRGIALFFLSHR